MALPPDLKTTYVDVPGLLETFADSIENFTFNDGIIRFELCVTRIQLPEGDPPVGPPSATRHPATRAVMPLNAAIELFNNMNKLFGALAQTGIIKKEASGSMAPAPKKPH